MVCRISTVYLQSIPTLHVASRALNFRTSSTIVHLPTHWMKVWRFHSIAIIYRFTVDDFTRKRLVNLKWIECWSTNYGNAYTYRCFGRCIVCMPNQVHVKSQRAWKLARRTAFNDQNPVAIVRLLVERSDHYNETIIGDNLHSAQPFRNELG